MSRGLVSGIAAALLLVALGLAFGEDPRERSATTFGRIGAGHGAFFELLLAVGLPPTRSYDAPSELPPAARVWWLEPEGPCVTRDGVDPDVASDVAAARVAAEWREGLAGFVSAGGTAVVLLPGLSRLATEAGAPLPRCSGLAGAPLPERTRAEADAPVRWRGAEDPPRTLPVASLSCFADALDWSVRAEVGDCPFVLERVLGAGRLVAVADGCLARNEWLDAGDAAPLLIDLVRRYGVERIDERSHGLRVERRPLAYLMASPALPVFLGLVALGGTLAWRGSALASTARTAPEPPAPTLDAFVASLARLYAGTGDSVRVARRYRALTLGRLRRHLGLPPDTPESVVLARIGARVTPAARQVLGDDVPVADAHGLRERVVALDAAAREVTG